ncbi:hypothetical protein CPB83DRAFT_664382 [Crepidotus variabilis]|uniref:Uncharacterized protein n=1 Tax=Crepidotus variabilis TaxID=179855 RepID=A0A9P6JTW5_9AGAR|nr:hypothetical protein CPB83DRAFT_664382 [Crepidotus variabilis]
MPISLMRPSRIVLPSFTLALTSERIFVPGPSHVIQFEPPEEQNYPQVPQLPPTHLMSTIYEEEYETEDTAVAPTSRNASTSTFGTKYYESSFVSMEISSTLESCGNDRSTRKSSIIQIFLKLLQQICLLKTPESSMPENADV